MWHHGIMLWYKMLDSVRVNVFLKLLCLLHVLCVCRLISGNHSCSDIYFYPWMTRCLLPMSEENPSAYSVTLRDITYNKLNGMLNSSPSGKHAAAFFYFTTLAEAHRCLYSYFFNWNNLCISPTKVTHAHYVKLWQYRPKKWGRRLIKWFLLPITSHLEIRRWWWWYKPDVYLSTFCAGHSAKCFTYLRLCNSPHNPLM